MRRFTFLFSVALAGLAVAVSVGSLVQRSSLQIIDRVGATEFQFPVVTPLHQPNNKASFPCTIGDYRGTCEIDTGNLTTGIVMSAYEYSQVNGSPTLPVRVEGITGTLMMPSEETTMTVVGEKSVSVTAYDSRVWQGDPLVGPGILRYFGSVMTINWQNGTVDFSSR